MPLVHTGVVREREAGREDRRGPGTLRLAAVPIGQIGDASPRLRNALASADVIAAEDTRRLRRLVRELGVTLRGRVLSYYDATERRRVDELLPELRAGRDVLLVTDAGMPTVSDPGHRLTTAAIEAGIPVSVLPGPSAVTAALAVSGLPANRFCFEGFLPRKAGERSRRLRELAAEPRTMVFFEAPHRIETTLSAMAKAFGEDRPVVVCRELTKTWEEVRRGDLGQLREWAGERPRGEITIVVAGQAAARNSRDPEELVAEVETRQRAGLSRKDAIADVATETGVARRVVYDAVIALGERERRAERNNYPGPHAQPS